MYDPEELGRDPGQRAAGPVGYMTLFGQLAHAHGLKVIQTPGPGPGDRARFGSPAAAGETADQWFIRVNIAGSAAAGG